MLAKHLGDKELVPRTYKELSQLINGGGGLFLNWQKISTDTSLKEIHR